LVSFNPDLVDSIFSHVVLRQVRDVE
jgi:hypothetical protein